MGFKGRDGSLERIVCRGCLKMVDDKFALRC